MIDEYLKTNASFLRLYKEYHEYKSLIIAVDFDNTLYDFHKKGEHYLQVMKLLDNLRDIGCTIIIWTANRDIEFVKKYLYSYDVHYDFINEDAPVMQMYFKGEPARKIFANAYIDDRSGLKQVYEELSLLISLVQKEIK